ncbi:hypothetical protein BH11ACT6_BH11ACT6_28470 [soil metagenome]
MFSPITSYDELGPVFTFGGNSLGTWISVILAIVAFIGFFARMIQHENHAYKAMLEHTPVEKGPVAEGEPPVY